MNGVLTLIDESQFPCSLVLEILGIFEFVVILRLVRMLLLESK